MNLPTLKKANVEERTVLLRADFDVPLKKTAGGTEVEDDFRLQEALPTIKHLIRNHSRIIIIAHLGRPKSPDDDHSLLPVAEHVGQLLKFKFVVIDERFHRLPRYTLPHLFFFKTDFRKPNIKKLLADLNPKDVAVLENIRFYPEEDQNDELFGKELASLADLFVNDAFASSYDERASTTAAPKFLRGFAGLKLEQEIATLSKILTRPARPYLLMAGGIKLADKMEGLKGLARVCDQIIVGGGLGTLFLAALDYPIRASILDKQAVPAAKELLRNYKQKILLPKDVVVARSPEKPETLRVTTPEGILPAEMILDIGPQTINLFSEAVKSAKTIVWTGPLGMFEVREFSHGTKALGRLFASRCGDYALGVAGGGDTINALRQIQMTEYVSHISVGGSAMLKFLAGEKLPGIEALLKKFPISNS